MKRKNGGNNHDDILTKLLTSELKIHMDIHGMSEEDNVDRIFPKFAKQ